MSVRALLYDILEKLEQLLRQNYRATSVRFVTITYRSLINGDQITMATALLDNVISNIPLEFKNSAGAVVPRPASGTEAVSIDNGAIGTVAMGADSTSVDFTPAQPPDSTQTGVITFTDGAISATLDVSLAQDMTATSADFVESGITTRPLGT